MTKAKRVKLHKHILDDYDIKLVGDEDHVVAFRIWIDSLRELERAWSATRDAEHRMWGAKALVASAQNNLDRFKP